MMSFAEALQCHTTAARLKGYADALDEDDDKALINILERAAYLLELTWDRYQEEEKQKAEKEHPEISK